MKYQLGRRITLERACVFTGVIFAALAVTFCIFWGIGRLMLPKVAAIPISVIVVPTCEVDNCTP